MTRRTRESPPRPGSAAACLLVFLPLLAACQLGAHERPSRQVPGGDPERGAAAIQRYGCGACHTVPGVPRAEGRVAPPLTDFADRAFVAGVLPNRPEALIRWIQDPPAVNPMTAMPNLGVDEEDARHIAAYLYTLYR